MPFVSRLKRLKFVTMFKIEWRISPRTRRNTCVGGPFSIAFSELGCSPEFLEFDDLYLVWSLTESPTQQLSNLKDSPEIQFGSLRNERLEEMMAHYLLPSSPCLISGNLAFSRVMIWSPIWKDRSKSGWCKISFENPKKIPYKKEVSVGRSVDKELMKLFRFCWAITLDPFLIQPFPGFAEMNKNRSFAENPSRTLAPHWVEQTDLRDFFYLNRHRFHPAIYTNTQTPHTQHYSQSVYFSDYNSTTWLYCVTMFFTIGWTLIIKM